MCITWIGWFQVLVIAMYGDVMSREKGPSNNPFFKDKISRYMCKNGLAKN
jgi:hypothetical protein